MFTSKSVPASTAPLKLQFLKFEFFKVATRKLAPAIRLSSKLTPFIFAPVENEIKRSRRCVGPTTEMNLQTASYNVLSQSEKVGVNKLASPQKREIPFSSYHRDIQRFGIFTICCFSTKRNIPSMFAFNPDGSSKLQPFIEAPSALQHNILTPCKLAPYGK